MLMQAHRLLHPFWMVGDLVPSRCLLLIQQIPLFITQQLGIRIQHFEFLSKICPQCSVRVLESLLQLPLLALGSGTSPLDIVIEALDNVAEAGVAQVFRFKIDDGLF